MIMQCSIKSHCVNLYVTLTIFDQYFFNRDWPKKIHTVSFLLYPVIGCLICMVVGMVVSIITGKLCYIIHCNRKVEMSTSFKFQRISKVQVVCIYHAFYLIGLCCSGTELLVPIEQEKYLHPMLQKLTRKLRKSTKGDFHDSSKSLELSTSYSYSNGYQSSESSTAQNGSNGHGTYTKKSSSLGRNLEKGMNGNGKLSDIKNYVNNGYKEA